MGRSAIGSNAQRKAGGKVPGRQLANRIGADGTAPWAMTILDLIRLLRRHWKLCVVIPLACMIAVGAFLVIRGQTASYTANAYIVAANSGQLSALNGTAEWVKTQLQVPGTIAWESNYRCLAPSVDQNL